MMDFVWLGWSLLLLLIWAGVYMKTPFPESRREMLLVSLGTSLLGLTEPIFVPAYWNPPSLFNLAQTTGFDIESIIFSFGIGGLASVLYERVLRGRLVSLKSCRLIVSCPDRLYPIIVTPAIFALLLVITSMNPIYDAVIALVIGGAFMLIQRPDLSRKMLASSIIFLGLYFVYFLTLLLAVPRYVPQVWNLPALSGILIAGVPLEELLFAASFGFFWSGVYELVFCQRVKRS